MNNLLLFRGQPGIISINMVKLKYFGSKRNSVKESETGFIPLLIALIAMTVFVIALAYLRVLRANG